MRALRILLISAVAAVLLAGTAVVGVASTNAGLRWLLSSAAAFVPGALEVTGLRGNLYTGARFTSLRLVQADLQLTATDGAVRVNWLALLAGELRLRQLSLGTLDIELAAAVETETAPRDLPEVSLPFGVRLDAARVGSLRIGTPDLAESLSDVYLDASLRGSQLRLYAAEFEVREARVTAAGELRLAEGWPMDLDISGALQSPAELAVTAAVSGEVDALRVAGTASVPEPVNFDAQLQDLRDALKIDLQASWDRVSLPPQDGRELRVADGSASLRGTVDDYTLKLQTRLEVAGIPAASLDASAQGSEDRLELLALRADWLGGAVHATGGADIGAKFVQVDVRAADLNIARFVPGWRAPLSGNLQLAGNWSKALEVQARLAAGPNEGQFNGALTPAPRGEFKVAAPELAALHREAAGAVELAGRFDLAAASPAVDMTGVGQRLRWGNSGEFSAQVQAAGTSEALQLRLRGRAADTRVAAAAVAAVDAAKARLSLGSAVITPPLGPSWTLSDSLEVVVQKPRSANPRLTTEAHCWSAEPATLCADAAMLSRDALDAGLRLRQLPLEAVALAALPQLRLSGWADADLALSGTPKEPVAALTWRQRDTLIANEEIKSAVALPVVDLRLNWRDSVLALAGQVASAVGVESRINGEVTLRPDDESRLAIESQTAIADLEQLSPLLVPLTGLTELGGRATINVQISGSLEQPRLTGIAELFEGHARISATGATLDQVSVRATAAGGERIDLTGSARAGDGSLQLRGDLIWRETELGGDLRLTGTDARVLRFPGQELSVSPDLRAQLADGELRVTGELQVPGADLVIEQLPQGSVRRSSDVTVATTESAVAAKLPLQVAADVALRLGESVRLRAFGLDTRLAGALRLEQAPGAVQPSAAGTVRLVDGNFEAYGRELRIERGLLAFTGPLDNPTVNVRAVRKLSDAGQDITIGVQLSGPLQNMESRLFGEPAMSESNALAYLVLNRPLQRSDSLASSELSGAAVALGMVNMLPVTEKLRNTLGLDEIEFSGLTRESSTLTAGKRVGEDFFIRYTYGLFEQIGRFVIRYDIGRGFSLEAGSGQEQTIDLLYSIDR